MLTTSVKSEKVSKMPFKKYYVVLLVIILQFLECSFQGPEVQTPSIDNNSNIGRQSNVDEAANFKEPITERRYYKESTDFEHENLRRRNVKANINAEILDTRSKDVDEPVIGRSTNNNEEKIIPGDESTDARRMVSDDPNNQSETKTRSADNTENVQPAPDGPRRIVGGTDVDISLYPYQAAYGINCAAAIIGDKWVITVAHCGEKPYVKTGSTYLNKGKQSKVKNYFPHPGWAAKNKDHDFDYDFQLLELAEPLVYDHSTKAIDIGNIEDVKAGTIITVTGWGNMEEDGEFSNVLRAVKVPIASKDVCQRVPFPYFQGRLTTRMFCGGYNNVKKDACQGDSGGPAIAGDKLVGMVSFGYGCATPGSYGVYSDVVTMRDWIKSITGLKLDTQIAKI